MIFKIIILLLIVAITYCLASGLYYLFKDDKKSNGLAKSLTLRTVLSLILFILLIIAFILGWVQPHGIRPPEWG